MIRQMNVRPCGRLRPTGNTRTPQNPTSSLTQKQDDKNRVSHYTLQTSGMSVLPNPRISAVLGYRRLHICSVKALQAAALVTESSLEAPYISELASRPNHCVSPTTGGSNGEA